VPRVLFTKVREVKDNEKNGPGANFLAFFFLGGFSYTNHL